MKTRFQLFRKWGITFGEAYQLEEHTARKVEYASKEDLIKAIFEKYPPKVSDREPESTSEKEAASGRLIQRNTHSLRSD